MTHYPQFPKPSLTQLNFCPVLRKIPYFKFNLLNLGSTIEKGHGRIEKSSYWTMGNTEFLIGSEKRTGLKSLGMVESERNVNGVVSIQQQYYILSIESDVRRFSQSVRSHWSIENQLHWILDVGFDKDASQCCRGYTAANLAVIRHVGINLLSRDKKTRVGVKTKRLKAGWDDNYLKHILNSLDIVSL